MSWIAKLFGCADVGANKDIEMRNLSMDSQMKITSKACGMIKSDVEKLLDDDVLSKAIEMAASEIIDDAVSVDCEALVDIQSRSDVTVITIKKKMREA